MIPISSRREWHPRVGATSFPREHGNVYLSVTVDMFSSLFILKLRFMCLKELQRADRTERERDASHALVHSHMAVTTWTLSEAMGFPQGPAVGSAVGSRAQALGPAFVDSPVALAESWTGGGAAKSQTSFPMGHLCFR